MKKIMAFLLAVVIVFSLTACGSEPEHTVIYEKAEYVGLEINEEIIDCVGIFTQYTNNSSESACAADWIACKVFQNGQEIYPIVPTEDKTEGYIQCDAYVESGETAGVIWLYQLEDMSPVTIELAGEKYTVAVTEE